MKKRNRVAMMAVLTGLIALAGVGARAQELTKVKVAMGDVSLNKLIFILAQEEGIYRKHGLEVEQFLTPGAAEVVRRSGVIIPPEFIREPERGEVVQFRIGGGNPMMIRRVTNARAPETVILATTDHQVRWQVMARKGITRPEELKGKRIGFSGVGAMSHYEALVFLREMGWDPVQDVSLMSQALAVDTLRDGRVDAFIADEIARAMAASEGFQVIKDLSDYNEQIAGSGVYAEGGFILRNPDTVRKFMRATVEAIATIKQNKPAALAAMTKWYGIKDREQQEFVYRDVPKLPRKPYPNVEGIKRGMKMYDMHEMRRHKPEDFYDDSFIKELDESGFIDSLYE